MRRASVLPNGNFDAESDPQIREADFRQMRSILQQIHDTHERWSNLAGAAFHGPVLRGPGQL